MNFTDLSYDIFICINFSLICTSLKMSNPHTKNTGVPTNLIFPLSSSIATKTSINIVQ